MAVEGEDGRRTRVECASDDVSEEEFVRLRMAS